MQALPPALAGLAKRSQFILYSTLPDPARPGKTIKHPRSPRTDALIDAHDSAHWCSAAEACAASELNGMGVGFVLTDEDPYFCVDIDNALDAAGQWSPVAQQLCSVFAGCGIEVSQSGKGLHIWGTHRGPMPPHGKRNGVWGLEFYTGRRFIALTGAQAMGNAAHDATALIPWLVSAYFAPGAGGASAGLTDAPVPEWRGPTDDDDLIRRALQSSSAASAFGQRASFSDLWSADGDKLGQCYPDAAGRPYDASAADAALCSHLAFWTGKHGVRIERLMRRSGLMRDKYDREDYLPRTIAEICAKPGDVLQDKAVESPVDAPREAMDAPEMDKRTGAMFVQVADMATMFKGCVYVVSEDKVYVPGRGLLSQSRFRALFGGHAYIMDDTGQRKSRNAWEAFTEHEVYRAPTADATCFKPLLGTGTVIAEPGRNRLNTYEPVKVPSHPGNAAPFLDHLRRLLPDDRDRQIILAYMAACVQHAGVKFQWAPVIQGAEGNGKTLLSRCVARAVGQKYTHWPKASKLGAQFNGWMFGKVFYAVEDIYVGTGKEDILEDLKPMITGGEGFEVESKGVDAEAKDICGNFIFNSNKKDGVKLTWDMRRYSMFFTAQQTSDDVAASGMDEAYFEALHAWLENEGFAIVTDLLKTYPIPHQFNPAGGARRAPRTTSSNEAVQMSRGSVEQQVAEAIAQGVPGFRGPWVSSTMLARLLDDMRATSRVPLNKRPEMMRTMGYILHPGLIDGRVSNAVAPDGKRCQLFVQKDSPERLLGGPAAIAAAYEAAQKVS